MSATLDALSLLAGMTLMTFGPILIVCGLGLAVLTVYDACKPMYIYEEKPAGEVFHVEETDQGLFVKARLNDPEVWAQINADNDIFNNVEEIRRDFS